MKERYFSHSDLARRWGVARQDITNRTRRHDDFPVPMGYINKGKVPFYDEDTVKAYENRRGITPNEEYFD